MINFLSWPDGMLWGLPLIILMTVTGLYFTVRSGFFQFRCPGRIRRHTFGTLFRRKADVGTEAREGMLSPFQAVAAAVGITSAIPAFVNAAMILILSGDCFRLPKDYQAHYMNIGEPDEDAPLFCEGESEVALL